MQWLGSLQSPSPPAGLHALPQPRGAARGSSPAWERRTAPHPLLPVAGPPTINTKHNCAHFPEGGIEPQTAGAGPGGQRGAIQTGRPPRRPAGWGARGLGQLSRPLHSPPPSGRGSLGVPEARLYPGGDKDQSEPPTKEGRLLRAPPGPPLWGPPGRGSTRRPWRPWRGRAERTWPRAASLISSNLGPEPQSWPSGRP